MKEKLSTEQIEKIRKILAVCISALTVITGVLYIAFCAHLYFTGGGDPYSRERVGKYLVPLLPVSILTVIAVAAGGVFSLIYPAKGAKPDALGFSYMLSRTAKRYPDYMMDAETRSAVLKERKNRIVYRSAALGMFAVCAVISLIFALDRSHYKLEDLNGEVLSIVFIALPLMAVALGGFVACSYLCESSCKRAYTLYQDATKNGRINKDAKPEARVGRLQTMIDFAKKHEKKIIIGLQGAVGIASVVFIIVGIINGGMADVLAKAVKICTECIGLG